MTMTSNLTNYHSHSLYCDGHAPIRDFLDEAVRQGFTSYGVSPHAPLPWTTRWTMLALELPVFIHEMHRLREEYKERLELYCGLEIDHIDQDINPQAGIFKNLTLDYKIGSVHLIHNQAGRLVDIDLNVEKFRKAVDDSFSGDVEYVVGKYFEAQMEMARTGGFDLLGHMDKISFNPPGADFKPLLHGQGGTVVGTRHQQKLHHRSQHQGLRQAGCHVHRASALPSIKGYGSKGGRQL